jgi:hypothetical protein
VSNLTRVLYLVEVCDPCESDKCAYHANGITVSDFITPHYYDPHGGHGVRYSFRGHIHQPHQVLEGGYVSFGNPVDNHWYQIIVEGGQTQLRDLGVLNRQGRSLRETIDHRVREIKKQQRYRLKPLAGAAKAAAASPSDPTGEARAATLRNLIKKL